MSTPPAPTDEEMAEWCAQLDRDAQSPVNGGWVRLSLADLIVLRAIARRLRQSAGKAEPGPTWQGEDGR